MSTLDDSLDDCIELISKVIKHLKTLPAAQLINKYNSKLLIDAAKTLVSLQKVEPDDDFKGMTEKNLVDRAAQLTAKLAAKKVD